MKIIGLALASGSGSRLYPISTEDRPKQFHFLLSDEMMVNQTIKRIKAFCDEEYTVTLEKYESWTPFLKSKVLMEPKRMETGFSVLYSLLKIQEEHGDCYIIQTPSDHHIGNQAEFNEAVNQGLKKMKKNDQIIILAEKPKHVETSYGMIVPNSDGETVQMFVEKPDYETAHFFMDQGALWNTAIYIYRLSTMIKEFIKSKPRECKYLSFSIKDGRDEVIFMYNSLHPFSFEKEILTRSNNLAYIETRMNWDDVGIIERLNKVRGENGWKEIKTNT